MTLRHGRCPADTSGRRRSGWLAGSGVAVSGLLAAYDALALSRSGGAPGFVASVLMGAIAPHVAIGGFLGACLSAAAVRHRPRLGVLGMSLGLLAASAPLVASVGTAQAVGRAGGSIAAGPALAFGSMAGSPDLVEQYADSPDGRIEIYRPAAGGGGAAPVLFDVHGGAWKSDGQMPATLRWFADHGWLVVRPSYPLTVPGRPTFETAPRAVATAYAWTLDQATRLGGDPSRVAILGDSAGGGLALNLAYRLASGDTPPDWPRARAPRAVLALYPTADPNAVEGVRRLAAGQAAVDYLGGTPAQVPQRYEQASSAHWATASAPPALVIHGSRDTFVPAWSVRSFTDEARRRGARVDRVELPLMDHAFDTVGRGSLGFQAVTTTGEAYLRRFV